MFLTWATNKQSSPHTFLLIVFVTIAYAFSGYFALRFAATSAYAAAVWAPSGIALAAALIWGLRCLPASFFGSLAVTFLIVHFNDLSLLSLDLIKTRGIIAIGATLQTFVGWYLVIRFIGQDSVLIKPKETLLFMLIIGPITSLISSSVGVFVLNFQNNLLFKHAILDWLSWWTDDTLGQIIFTPLFLILFAHPREVWRPRIKQILAPMFCIIVIVIIAYQYIGKIEQRRLSIQFENDINQRVMKIENRLNTAANITQALAAHISVRGNNLNKFDAFTSLLEKELPYIQTLEWAPRVIDKQQFEKEYNLPITRIKNNDLSPTKTNGPYYPIIESSPLLRPRNRVLGYDLYSQSIYREAMDASLKTGQTTMTENIAMFPNTPDQQSVLFFAPVFNKKVLRGYAITIINLNQILNNIIGDKTNFSQFIISDQANELGDIFGYYKYYNHKNFYYHDSLIKETIPFFGRNWEFVASPSKEFLLENYSWQIWSILIASFIFCAFMNIILFLIFGQRSIIERNLQAVEEKNLLLLNSAGEGIYGLNKKGLVTFINPAACKMLDYKQNELLNQPIHLLLNTNNKTHQTIEGKLTRKDGTEFWAKYTSTPILTNGKTTGLVVVFTDITKRIKTENNLKRLANYDSLTELPNRVSFLKQLNQLLANHKNTTIAVCFIDIDNFKQVNDALGHSIGDELLVSISKLITSIQRPSDFLARLGGDEFGLIISEFNNQAHLATIINQYLSITESPVQLKQFEQLTSISIGISLYPSGGKNSEELVKNADIAMYSAKSNGKNTYAFYDSQMDKQITRRHQLESALQKAIDKNELTIHYHPQINCNDNKIHGVEALVRWNNEEFGNVSPSEFIPIAEESGLILSLGTWILRTSCREYLRLKTLYPNIELSINVSIRQFESPSFVDIFKTTVKRYNLPYSLICLEITETALMRSSSMMPKIMRELSQLGVRLALDDFGMGYSSMQYLRHLPISFIKIDRKFISELNDNPKAAAIVESIIHLANSLCAITIAEGVQTHEQYQHLKDIGCEIIQGYFYAEPMPISELSLWLGDYIRQPEEDSLTLVTAN